jgi:hypothetical protein
MVIMNIRREFSQRAMIMAIVFVTLLITSVTGCETFGPKYDASRSAIAPLDNEKGRIIFYRPGNFLWYGYTERPAIFLDGQKVGISRPSSIFYVDVEPGEHRVTIPAAVYAGQVSIDVQISKGETVYVKNNVGVSVFAGKMTIEMVDPGQATTEIDGLEFVAYPMR